MSFGRRDREGSERGLRGGRGPGQGRGRTWRRHGEGFSEAEGALRSTDQQDLTPPLGRQTPEKRPQDDVKMACVRQRKPPSERGHRRTRPDGTGQMARALREGGDAGGETPRSEPLPSFSVAEAGHTSPLPGVEPTTGQDHATKHARRGWHQNYRTLKTTRKERKGSTEQMEPGTFNIVGSN